MRAATISDFQSYFVRRNFNPHGEYVKRWVPELRRVQEEFVHMPGQMPREVAHAAQFEIGEEYPAPMVDHPVQRERAPKIYNVRPKFQEFGINEF